ncbi:glutamate synthase subunit beta [Lactococcus lactis]|uniref:NADPH-dependent glutamate synthase beta chain and related oxidoreductases n=1 Tax=Lactococcus lactis subsp. lactis TaxID=1360 RepID=A0A0B8QZI4_LACLL|nr:glutamate synthase subunit beta [Lactococcus lactis]KST89189.1 Glutamate synthase (NADPH) small chain [Lactococcus lactis subsp. lactis]MBU3886410.1 glutamate synthase subunit beta [Lactococcus lactis]MCT0061683.1 glutamate synthase subunit beta [Lactococcus lactis subsp. lactis]MCT0076377.1 glutamate synthase subunit beta [Lactococcus lactis subsp. lactis]MCT0137645.1 glutamate synthase subunit beta [Lactococcus lactis subsp. lactis]
MADPNGFLNYPRNDNPYRELAERIKDFAELQVPLSTEERQKQAARCMHCDVPFCHQGIFYGGKRAVSGCPNDNHIPEWNDLIYRGLQRKAYERLILTNPFPEFTGRVCPAPCEKSCAEALNGAGVTIKDNERFLGDLGNDEGWVAEIGKAAEPTGYKIAIIGSGPAGLSAAWRLNQLGHSVTVFEKSDRLGGLLMYGIPNMKLDKKVVQKRIDLMTELGVTFVTNTEIGKTISYEDLSVNFDRIILAIGAGIPRDLNISGREAIGIRFAIDFLTETTKTVLEEGEDNISQSLKGKKVVVIGGGDTGNDCIGTAVRLGAASVSQLEITPSLPTDRLDNNPWPEWPMTLRAGYGQKEAEFVGNTDLTTYQMTATAFQTSAEGQLTGLKVAKVGPGFKAVEGTEQVIEADLVLLAMGFVGTDTGLLDKFGVQEIYDDYRTNNDKVLVAGDARRGPSLVIWAIREGRKTAEIVDEQLIKVATA